MIAGLLATLAHPRWWALALAAFLVRGGILVVAIPILALPSVPDLSAALGTTFARLALGHPAVLVVLAVAAGAGALALLLATGAIGAWFEQALFAGALADEDVADAVPAGLPIAGVFPALGVRLIAHVPTAAAVAWAGMRLGALATDELLRPQGAGSSVFDKVVAGAPEAIAAVLVVWALAELVSGVAVRRVGAAHDTGVMTAVRVVAGAARDVIRHPSLALTWLIASAAVLAAVLPTWLATSVAFARVRAAVAGEGAGSGLGLALVVLVATWVAGLGLIGLATAWRSVATTVAVERVARERRRR